MDKGTRPTTETDRPNLSSGHHKQGDARPNATLDQGQPHEEMIPRKTSLTHGGQAAVAVTMFR